MPDIELASVQLSGQDGHFYRILPHNLGAVSLGHNRHHESTVSLFGAQRTLPTFSCRGSFAWASASFVDERLADSAAALHSGPLLDLQCCLL